MLKQKKNLNAKTKLKKIFKKKKRLKKKKNIFIPFYFFKQAVKSTLLEKTSNNAQTCTKIQPIKFTLYVTLKQNNIFATLFKRLKVYKTKSTGMYNIKMSKKKRIPHSKMFFKKLFRAFKNVAKKKTLLFVLTAPRSMRLKILQYSRFALSESYLVFGIKPHKSFNGCRSKKQKRTGKAGLKVLHKKKI